MQEDRFWLTKRLVVVVLFLYFLYVWKELSG
jgi:hypothetical protein